MNQQNSNSTSINSNLDNRLDDKNNGTTYDGTQGKSGITSHDNNSGFFTRVISGVSATVALDFNTTNNPQLGDEEQEQQEKLKQIKENEDNSDNSYNNSGDSDDSDDSDNGDGDNDDSGENGSNSEQGSDEEEQDDDFDFVNICHVIIQDRCLTLICF